jgi:hypothetical protein
VLSVSYAVTFDESFHFFEAFTSPDSTNHRVGDTKENVNQSSTHGEVVILELVPFWRAQNILSSRSVNHYFV